MHFFSQSVLLRALGWSLVNSLWQMALLWLIYLILTGMGSRFSARAKHNIGLLLSTGGFLWFIFGFILRLDGQYSYESINTISLNSDNRYYNFLFLAKKTIAFILPYLSSVYLGSLLVILMRYIKYYIDLRYIKIKGLHKMQPELRLFTQTISLQMGIKKKVTVWLSSIVDSPMTIGFLKPIILIPLATINHLTTEQVESILLHELTHIKRNDYLVNFFVTVSGILFFFNPFSRLLINSIKKEREHSCDDLVMQFQYNPHVYASALFSLAKNRHQRHRLAMMAIDPNSQLLLERIKRVTGHHHRNRRFNFASIGCFMIAILAGIGFLKFSHPALKTANRQSVNKVSVNPVNEASQKTFVFTSFTAVKEKPKIAVKPKRKKEIKDEDNGDEATNDVVAVSNDEAEPQDESEVSNANAVFIPEKREYSIVTSPNIPPPAPAAAEVNAYPYVPNSSFSFQILEDTLKPRSRTMTYDDLEAEVTMQKSLQALNQIDWEKIAKEMSRNGKKVDINKLKNEITKSLQNVDWNQINQDIPSTISNADQKRILENLQMQSQYLQDRKYTNRVRVQTLQRQIRIQQQNWNQNELRKEAETLEKAGQQTKKKILRITYI